MNAPSDQYVLTEHWPIRGSRMKHEDRKTGLATLVLHALHCSQIFTIIENMIGVSNMKSVSL